MRKSRSRRPSGGARVAGRLRRSSAYIPLLRDSAVRSQAATGLVAQVTQGAAGVGIVLVVRQHTGSLPLAGAVVGALSIAAGVSRPVQGRLIDRRGPTGVMVACGVAHPAALIGIVGLSDVNASTNARALHWLLVVLGVVAGLALPPVSTSMRARWGEVVTGGERTAAYSLVYLVQELSILAGPLVLSAVTAASTSSVALIVVAALAGAGTLAFAASIGAHHGAKPAIGHHATPRRSGHPLRVPAVRVVLLAALLLGAVIGALEVAVPIFATAHGAPAAAGLLIAALSVGGIAGAAIYGSVRWRAAPARRLALLLGLMTIWLGLAIAADTLLLLGVLLLLAGVPLNPALATFSLLIDEHVPPGAAAEAFGWLSTAIAGGTGAASAVAAVVAHRHDAQAAFAVAAIAGAIAAAVAALALRTRR
jgi:MFS family permease